MGYPISTNSVGKVGFEPTVFLCNGFTDRRHSAIVTASPNLQATNVFSEPNLQCCTSTIVLGALSSHLVVLIYLVNSEQTPLCSVPMHLLPSAPESLNGTALCGKGGIRTPDAGLFRPTLYQLSYLPKCVIFQSYLPGYIRMVLVSKSV